MKFQDVSDVFRYLKNELPDIFDEVTHIRIRQTNDLSQGLPDKIVTFNWHKLEHLGYEEAYIMRINRSYFNEVSLACEWIIKNQWDIRFKLL